MGQKVNGIFEQSLRFQQVYIARRSQVFANKRPCLVAQVSLVRDFSCFQMSSSSLVDHRDAAL